MVQKLGSLRLLGNLDVEEALGMQKQFSYFNPVIQLYPNKLINQA